MKRRSFLLLSILFATACSINENVSPTYGIDYLKTTLDVIGQNAAYTKNIDWASFRSDLETTASSLPSLPDAYPFIRQALEKVNDPHSSFARFDYSFAVNPADGACSGFAETSLPTLDNIGFIQIVGSFSGAETQYQARIKEQDNKDIRGWIIDLRGVDTNEIWPMLAGIGPILGDGLAGYYMTATTEKTFGYQNGKAIENGTTEKIAVTSPYTLINKNPKVAVLINNGTKLSGEALAVAFRGRANTKFFGVATCGRPGNIKTFELTQYQTVLTVTLEMVADRNKNKQLTPVNPDVQVTPNTSEIYEKAAEWINEN